MLIVDSQVPIFLQSHSRARRLYSGLAESCGFRTLFEMVELRSTPPQYSHLAGLLDVFKAKLVYVSLLHCCYVDVCIVYTAMLMCVSCILLCCRFSVAVTPSG